MASVRYNTHFLTEDEGRRNRLVGQAGELRVASELLLRGLNPAIYSVDEGTDIVLQNGKRLQVKTSIAKAKSTRKYSYTTYMFNTLSKKYKGVRRKLDKTKIDFLVCWCINDDEFYVIPVTDLPDTNVSIVKDPLNKGEYRYTKYLEAWESLRD